MKAIDESSPRKAADNGRRSASAAFRRLRAKLAAHALHAKRPNIAKDAGRRGGHATATRFALGRRAWGVQMAMRRWYGTAFDYQASRAPEAGSGAEADGTVESDPATARRPDTNVEEKS